VKVGVYTYGGDSARSDCQKRGAHRVEGLRLELVVREIWWEII